MDLMTYPEFIHYFLSAQKIKRLLTVSQLVMQRTDLLTVSISKDEQLPHYLSLLL